MFSARFSLRLLALLALAAPAAVPLQAQISTKAVPYSFRATLPGDLPTYTMPATPQRVLADAPPLQDRFGNDLLPPRKLGVEAAVGLGLDNAGRWTALPDGGWLWRLRLTSEGAAFLHLIYDDFWMPPGAQLFLYNEDRSVVLGAFTEHNNKAHGGFATDFVAGETTILEYYEPPDAQQPGRLHIATMLHGTDPAYGASKGQASASDPYAPVALPCSINVACSQASGWSSEIKSVVRISNGCNGVLVNNVEEDETPYLLTAYHCGTPAVGDTLNWVFKFNYQSGTCGDPATTPVPQTVSGAVVRAADASYDFALLELLEGIPQEYDAYYAGWSRQDVSPTSGAVIGHPGDIKKITFDDDPIPTYIQSQHFWMGFFDRGTIEAGSSGSPLFNQNSQLVGIVSSSLYLDYNACSGPGGDDNLARILFPKFSSIWNVGSSGQRIADFLDPANAGTVSLPPLQNTGQNLPVELVSFDAVLDGHALDLRWETASETNNAGFEVQHLAGPADAAWQVRGWIEGHGTTLEAQAYAYRLDNLAPGTHRFRLKQIDFDGTFEYSPEVEVAVGIPTAYHLAEAYPNPFNPETRFSLSVATAQEVQVSVYDVVGRRVALLYDGRIEAQTTRAFTFEAHDLPSGVYLIRAQGQRFVTSQMVTLLK